jgi:secreted protein with Ig-like and vWFA domain
VKVKSLLLSSVILAAVSANAAPTLGTGTPGNSVLASPTGPSPNLGGTLINFDDLTPGTSVGAAQYATQGVSSISSPGGLTAIPFSTQSSPNELFDGSPNGTAHITIDLATGASSIGIGIADSDPFAVTLQALAADGTALGSPFTVTIPGSGVNSGNGYFTISDTSNDIFGLEIQQDAGSINNSGLAIDDLQFASTSASVPEPTTYALFGAGAVLLALLGKRKRA